MSHGANAVVPAPSAPTWKNWSGNLVHSPSDGVKYYFMPANLAELKSVLVEAKTRGVKVRVTGQRHSQPPLVIDDTRDAPPQKTTSYLVDMSCYKDLGPDCNQSIVLGPGGMQVTVNTGVREDELDAFLTKNNLMLKTVTAGGFFSLGGMTAVDVHGGTIDAPIFAETVTTFNLVLADGTVKTIQESPTVDGWSPLQFARVSLGGLGIVTSVTIDVMKRSHATTLQGGVKRFRITEKEAFVSQFESLLESHARLETFFTPYAAAWWGQDSFWALWWDVSDQSSEQTLNQPPQPYPPTACNLAGQSQPVFGAPFMGSFLEGFSQAAAQAAQSADFPEPAGVIAKVALDVIEKQVAAANQSHSELWLAEAARVIFMSYYVPLPDLKTAGLGIVWDGLEAVSRIVTRRGCFHMAAPMEFRFVKGGNSAMSGTYSNDPDAVFVNLDLIGFVDDKKASSYPPELLQFFADVEREWVKMGGFPHQGKMYGFFDPTDQDTHSKTTPFNPRFLAELRTRRGERLKAFNAYRKSLDPNGLFYNDFLRQLLEG